MQVLRPDCCVEKIGWYLGVEREAVMLQLGCQLEVLSFLKWIALTVDFCFNWIVDWYLEAGLVVAVPRRQ